MQSFAGPLKKISLCRFRLSDVSTFYMYLLFPPFLCSSAIISSAAIYSAIISAPQGGGQGRVGDEAAWPSWWHVFADCGMFGVGQYRFVVPGWESFGL